MVGLFTELVEMKMIEFWPSSCMFDLVITVSIFFNDVCGAQ